MSHAWWLAAMVIMVGLTGCAGKEDVQGTDDPGVVDVDGTPVAADKGIVLGRVFTDAGLVVMDARVFIPGTGFDVDTKADGRFRFVNVSAGAATLRVEADGFQVHERSIQVVAAQVLEVNVTLLPLQGLGGSYLPHVHDFWRGRDQIVVLDEVIDLRERRVGSASSDKDHTINYVSAAVLYANMRYPRYPVPLAEELPDGNPGLVYPGTERIEVTLTWDDAPPMPPTYAFGYRPAADGDEDRLPAGPSGTTWTIPVGPTQADNGHQRYTLWNFYIIPDNDVASAPDYRPSAVMKTVHITITVFRGDEPPVEPAHPTFWADGDVLELRSFANGSFESTGLVGFGSNPKFLPAPGKIVPPGTQRLEVEVIWSYQTPTVLDIPYELYYHTALTSPTVDFWVGDWPKATLIEEGPGRRVYEIVLGEGEADGYYQERSAWRFAPRPEGHDPDGITPDHYRARSINAAVTAFREATAEVQ